LQKRPGARVLFVSRRDAEARDCWGWLLLRRPRRHDGDERCDHPRIKPIVLGQKAAGLGELPQLERIDLAHGHAGRKQGPDDTTFVTTTCLDADRRYRGAAQLLDQFAQPAASLLTEEHCSSGNTVMSKRSFDTSIPPKESIAIFVSLPC